MCDSLTVGGECDVCVSLCVCVVGSGGAQGEGKPCGQVAGGAEQPEGAPGRGQPSLCQAEGEALSLTFVHHWCILDDQILECTHIIWYLTCLVEHFVKDCNSIRSGFYPSLVPRPRFLSSYAAWERNWVLPRLINMMYVFKTYIVQ